MSLRLPRLPLLLATAVLLTTMGGPTLANDGPGASPLGPDASPGTLTTPEGITWRLTQARLSGAFADIPAEVEATLEMRDGHAAGSGGCNQWFADYTLDGSALDFGPIGSTLMLCEGPGGDVETFYLADLDGVTQWRIEDGRLLLSGDDGEPALAFEQAAAPALDGQWLVTSYNDGQGQLVDITDGSTIVTIANGSIDGTAGCNQFRGTLTSQDSGIVIGPLMSTKMACQPDSLMQREAGVMAALEASVAVQATADGGWTLLDLAGTPQVTLAPADHVVDPSASPSA